MKYIYINSLHDEAVHMIRAHGTAKADEAQRAYKAGEEANKVTFTQAMNKIITGEAKVIYTSHTGQDWRGTPYTTYTAYHRSPKQPGCIQESHYYIKHGEMIALSDAQHRTPEEAYKDGTPSGTYIIR